MAGLPRVVDVESLSRAELDQFVGEGAELLDVESVRALARVEAVGLLSVKELKAVVAAAGLADASCNTKELLRARCVDAVARLREARLRLLAPAAVADWRRFEVVFEEYKLGMSVGASRVEGAAKFSLVVTAVAASRPSEKVQCGDVIVQINESPICFDDAEFVIDRLRSAPRPMTLTFQVGDGRWPADLPSALPQTERIDVDAVAVKAAAEKAAKAKAAEERAARDAALEAGAAEYAAAQYTAARASVGAAFGASVVRAKFTPVAPPVGKAQESPVAADAPAAAHAPAAAPAAAHAPAAAEADYPAAHAPAAADSPLDRYGIKELRRIIEAAGLSHTGLVEKSELRARAVVAQMRLEAAKAAALAPSLPSATEAASSWDDFILAQKHKAEAAEAKQKKSTTPPPSPPPQASPPSATQASPPSAPPQACPPSVAEAASSWADFILAQTRAPVEAPAARGGQRCIDVEVTETPAAVEDPPAPPAVRFKPPPPPPRTPPTPKTEAPVEAPAARGGQRCIDVEVTETPAAVEDPPAPPAVRFKPPPPPPRTPPPEKTKAPDDAAATAPPPSEEEAAPAQNHAAVPGFAWKVTRQDSM
ncbi:hypothetical protein M885DRAFT_626845 [Pelagophyceae sp. CCMP2097]|nr:hypothetical protein M885DRAFT_626845 [Pelagophyceae sp. CCMP2097]